MTEPGINLDEVISHQAHVRISELLMESKWMLLPMFAQTLITFGAMQIARNRRLRAIKAGEVSGTYFKTMEGPKPPRDVLQSDQLVLNFFETPILFFGVALAAMSLNLVTPVLVSLASIYAMVRILHAQIKLTHNKLGPRAMVFTVSLLIVVVMWGALLFGAFT